MSFILWIMNHYLVISSIFLMIKYMDWGVKYSLLGSIEAFRNAYYASVIPLVGMAIDPDLVKTYLILCVPMLLGIVARFGSLYKKRMLNKRNVITQLLVTVPFCAVAFWIWEFYKIEFPIHLIIAGVSYFSITIVGIENETGELAIRGWLYKMSGGLTSFLKPKNDD